ncbi:MAG: phage tail protein, partial [Bacteroidota bacterium]|nr:phage tail protein [Bacteroidota bacterium]
MKKIVLMGLFALSLGFASAQPSGSITAFAGPKNKIPKGWVVCDGTLFDRTKSAYAALFNAIGVSWGGDVGNKFAVPDLRGQFLRGVSDASEIDPDKDSRSKSRTDLNSSGNGGNAVGSKEKDELKTHVHYLGGLD